MDKKYTEETYYLNFTDKVFQEIFQKAIEGCNSDKERLKQWYLYVRDNWIYDPYTLYLTKEKYRASDIVTRKSGHCIDKSILFISGLRALNIPSSIHLAKVKNHISAERIIEKIGTDELSPHGYAGVYFEGKWTKASPIFDSNLCQYLNVYTLEYDGTEDSIFQEFNKEGAQFMEYLEDYGEYADVPFENIKEILAREYPDTAAQAIASGLEQLKF